MPGILYRSLKIYCNVALRFYFKKLQIAGKENIPEGPVIFVPNHPNAFLDAVLITCSSSKNPWYITRAGAFKTPRAEKILKSLQLLPVYRFRDGYASLKNNDKTMEDCILKLNKGESIIIFAEGNPSSKYHLLKLQKGFARIAFGTKPDKNITVVPVGLQYSTRSFFRSDVLVNFGAPIKITSRPLDDRDKIKVYDELIKNTESQLKKLMLHIEYDDYEKRLQHLYSNRNFKKDLVAQLQEDQQIIKQYPDTILKSKQPQKINIFNRLARYYFDLNAIVPQLLIKYSLLPKIKDPQFMGSVKFSTGMFLVPIFILLQTFIFYFFTESLIISVLYLISIPLSLRVCEI